jgi:hypothetical protein
MKMKFECYEFFDEIGQKVGWQCGPVGSVSVEHFNKKYDCDAVEMRRFRPTVGEVFPKVSVE